jgi:hypothetical protein
VDLEHLGDSHIARRGLLHQGDVPVRALSPNLYVRHQPSCAERSGRGEGPVKVNAGFAQIRASREALRRVWMLDTYRGEDLAVLTRETPTPP